MTAMRAVKIVTSLYTKGGLKVVLRTPKWMHLDDLLELINSLVDEMANIPRIERGASDLNRRAGGYEGYIGVIEMAIKKGFRDAVSELKCRKC